MRLREREAGGKEGDAKPNNMEEYLDSEMQKWEEPNEIRNMSEKKTKRDVKEGEKRKWEERERE